MPILCKGPRGASIEGSFELDLLIQGAYQDEIDIIDPETELSILSEPVQFEAGATSARVALALESEGDYIFTSGVAKAADGTKDYYKKLVTLTRGLTGVNVMPDGALHWYGSECADVSGGWITKAGLEDTSFQALTPTITQLSNGVKIVAPKSNTGVLGQCVYATKTKLDTTNWDSMIFNGTLLKNQTGEYDSFTVLCLKTNDDYTGIVYGPYVNASADVSGVIKKNRGTGDFWNKTAYLGWRFQTNPSYNQTLTMYSLLYEKKRSLPASETEDVTFTIVGAKADQIVAYDKYGEVVDYINFDSTATSKEVTLAIRKGGETIRFVSYIAKDPTDKKANYYKMVDVDSSITNVKLMPDDVTMLYWYGNSSVTFTKHSACSSYNKLDYVHSSCTASMTVQTNSIKLSTYTTGSGTDPVAQASFYVPFNATNKSKLCYSFVKSGSDQQTSAFVHSTTLQNTAPWEVSGTIQSLWKGTGTHTIDISSISGTNYFVFLLNGTSQVVTGTTTVTFDTLWLE